MNEENTKINNLSNCNIVQLAGICKVFGLNKKHKEILFNGLTNNHWQAVDKLILILQNNNAIDFSEVEAITANFGEMPIKACTVIWELRKLGIRMKKYCTSNKPKVEDVWKQNFFSWIHEQYFFMKDSDEVHAADKIIELVSDNEHLTNQELIIENIINDLISVGLCKNEEKMTVFISKILNKIAHFKDDCQNVIVFTPNTSWTSTIFNWFNEVQFIKPPYKGANFCDYLISPGLNKKPPTQEDIVDRISCLYQYEIVSENFSARESIK